MPRKRQRPTSVPVQSRTGVQASAATEQSDLSAAALGPAQPVWLWLLVRGLLLAALMIAAYLAWHALTGGRPVGCGPGSGCDRVLGSRWAWWFGVPVSLLAAGTYAAMLWATFSLHGGGLARWRWVAVQMLIGGSAAVLLMAVWFMGLQGLVLRAFCRFCAVAHLCGSAAAVLLLWQLARARPHQPLQRIESGLPPSPPSPAGMWGTGLWAAVAAAAGLVLGQLVHQPKTFLITTIPAQTNAVAATGTVGAGAPGLSAQPLAGAIQPTGAHASQGPRLFSFYDGRFTLDLQEVPVIGSPTNPHVIVSLFDYTCHHCQVMHKLLVEAQQRFSNALVIASLPVPLDPQCNPWVRQAPPEHTNACAYARLGLAVWRADRTKHRAFDDWLFSGPTPPPLAEAIAKAQTLVGAAALAQAQQHPWIDAQLKLALAVYGVAYRANRGDMPQMIVGNQVALGSFPRDEFFALLERNFGLKTSR